MELEGLGDKAMACGQLRDAQHNLCRAENLLKASQQCKERLQCLLQFEGFVTAFFSALTCIKLHLCRLIGVIAKCRTFSWRGVATGAKNSWNYLDTNGDRRKYEGKELI